MVHCHWHLALFGSGRRPACRRPHTYLHTGNDSDRCMGRCRIGTRGRGTLDLVWCARQIFFNFGGTLFVDSVGGNFAATIAIVVCPSLIFMVDGPCMALAWDMTMISVAVVDIFELPQAPLHPTAPRAALIGSSISNHSRTEEPITAVFQMTLALVAPLADSDDVELEQRRQQQNRRRNHQRRQQRRRLPNTTMVQHGDGGGDRLLSTESAHQDKSTPPDSQFIIDTSTVVDVANACQLDNIATRPMHSNVGHSMGGGVKQQSERQQQKQQKQHQQGHWQRPRNRQRRKHKIPTTNINMQTSNSLPDDVNKKNMMQPPPLLPLEDVNNDPPTSNPQQANTKVNPRRRRIRNRNRHQHQFNTMYNTNGSEFIQDYRAESNVTTASDTNSTTDNNLETSRKDEVQNGSLASKLRYAMELEHQHRQQQLVEQQRQQSQKSSWGGGVYLTTLSSIRPPSSPSPVSTDANKDRTKIDDANHDSYEHDGEFSNRQSAATTTSATTASLTSTLDATLMIPNAKIKWTDSELSKMRHRWWEALRLKRTNATVHCDDVDRVLKSQLGASSSTREDDADDDSTFSSSSTSLDEVPSYDVCSDAMEPPSLSAPFDEGYISSGLPPTTSTTIPPPVLSNPVIDLERKCIESGCPIHCAIYNHALYHNGLRLDYFDDHHDATPTKPVKSDAEVVLHRLLTMHSIDGILRWKSMRVGLSDMRGLEGNKYPEERVNILTDATVHVLSADITSLTPLQLAVFWNLPDIIRLLCTTGVQPQTLKNSIEEDEKCRTPLMLACELGHVACIKAIMCASTFKKLDRRESEGGNSVFHFCCIGSSSSFECNQKSKDVDDDENQCAVRSSRRRDAIDVLLQYTPIKDQKIALLSTNRKGQNIFHLVCSQADVMLLQRLLEMQNLPGVNISKALDATDINGNTPFLCAIAADS